MSAQYVDPRGPHRTVAKAFHSCQGTFVLFAECGHVGEYAFNMTSLKPGASIHCFKCTLVGEKLARSEAATAESMAEAEAWPGSERFVIVRAAPSRAQRRALQAAAIRPRGTLCPVVGARGILVRNAAESALLGALYRRGWADENGGVPVITAAGRAAIATGATP